LVAIEVYDIAEVFRCVVREHIQMLELAKAHLEPSLVRRNKGEYHGERKNPNKA
jgi:hypothetical protein